MYRTNDPRFRRRLNELGQTLENANETAQSGIYIFGQKYIAPCLDSVATAFTDCVDASCPSLNLRNRDRIRRQRGQTRATRGGAELSFDFYDDWDEDENDGLLGWGNDEFDRLLAGGGGYGTVTNTQPARQRGMSYPKARRKSAHNIEDDAIPGSTGFLSRLFGGKPLRYKPSAAGLQEHPGARHTPEGEALLEESEPSEAGGRRRRSTRNRSGTTASRETQDSFSSRGDLFASDDEDDAVPIDEEFAMVLERRTTNSGNVSGPDTENSSDRAIKVSKRGKRPSATSRGSSRRTMSSRSLQSAGSGPRSSRASSSTALAAAAEIDVLAIETAPSLEELQQEEEQLAMVEEASVRQKRQDAQDLAAEHGLAAGKPDTDDTQTPQASAPPSEPSQLPTPVPTDDEASVDGTQTAP